MEFLRLCDNWMYKDCPFWLKFLDSLLHHLQIFFLAYIIKLNVYLQFENSILG